VQLFWASCHITSLIHFVIHETLYLLRDIWQMFNYVLARYCYHDQTKDDEMDKACSTHGREVHRMFCWEKPGGTRPLGRPTSNDMMILKWILNKYGVRVWTGFFWLGIGTSGGLL
jgi:hypothetical protein